MSQGSSKQPSKDSDAKWLRNYTFLLDENYCGEPLRKFLSDAGWRVKLHAEVLARSVLDAEVLEKCASERLILVTPDANIYLVQDHLAVLRKHKLAIIVLRVPKSEKEVWTTWGTALVYNQARILRALRWDARPFVIKVVYGATTPCVVTPIAAVNKVNPRVKAKGDAA